MKPRFFVGLLSLVFLVAPASRANGFPASELAFVAIASHQEDLPAQSPLDHQKDRQGTIRSDEKVVVTAEREIENIRNIGSSVSLITSDEITASGARWLIDVLQFAPGVNVVRSGPAGSLAQVFIRGSNTSQTLFLIDGVKVNSPTTGAYDISGIQLSADQIDRIEIVRGPQSNLYGSQAIGGVINVITRRGSGSGAWGVEAEGGSYSTSRFSTWGSGQINSARLAGGISYFDSGGFSSANEANGHSEPDSYKNLSYNGRVDYGLNRGMVASAFIRGFNTDVDFDGFDFVEGPVDNLVNLQTSSETVAGGTVGYRGEGVHSTVEISTSVAGLTTDTPEDFYTGFELNSSIREVDWQSGMDLPGAQTLVTGLEYRREQATSLSRSGLGEDFFSEEVDFVGVYVQDRIRIADRARVTGGVRLEDHSTFGRKWTGRATATVDVNQLVRVHGSMGSGFKAPTLNDLYFPGFSNPDLQPEESVGFDVGIDTFVPSSQVSFDVTFFYNDISQLIEFDFVSGRPENLGDVITVGAEVGGEYKPNETLTLSGNYTLTDATSESVDGQLIRRPRHQGGIRVTVRPDKSLRFWSELRVKGESFDNGANGRERLDGFAIVNLAVNYQLLNALSVRTRIDNLLDTDYEEVLGFGTVGLSGYFGVTLTLSR
jgi:vitamin B12 transporter